MELFYDILKQLIRIPSVVGEEHPFFMFIKRELEELGVKVEYEHVEKFSHRNKYSDDYE